MIDFFREDIQWFVVGAALGGLLFELLRVKLRLSDIESQLKEIGSTSQNQELRKQMHLLFQTTGVAFYGVKTLGNVLPYSVKEIRGVAKENDAFAYDAVRDLVLFPGNHPG